ncbi:MAG: PilZ domain-containing protein [Nitrospira sp.]|nr:PilZ domain-containing protein [Nitrospira sp.]MBH0181890.1 PilZ domain-containing protein [Nitrospira sp.]MBH0185219.1 PilZ domain-containing protein [Nitrospira sp.]MBH0196425.1 PilZ domain-containing protein [Nitrospira sp.]
MVVRKFPRLSLTLPCTLIQRDKLRYTGSVKDLSQKGCRIESVIRPFTGMQLEVQLQPLGEATPITISNAAVRWTGSHGIGFEFLTVSPPDQARLNRILEQHTSKVGAA